jgi:poly(A) polymerase
MNPQAELEFERILQAVRDCKAPEQKVYLVGGAVRDLLLGKGVHDFDFVTSQGSRNLTKALRKKLGGGYFTLDDERGFNRLILDGGTPNERHIDIAEFVGGNLRADLKARDFRINAMAIDVDQADVLIDPLGGVDDLELGILHMASPDSFEKDPLRVLRAVRMLQAYSMGLAPETSEQLRIAIKDLGRVSSERVRDELFNILNLENNEDSLRMLWYLGILSEVFPCVPRFEPHEPSESNISFDQSLKRVACLENYYLHLDQPILKTMVTLSAQAVPHKLAQWQSDLKKYLDGQLTRGRTIRNLLILLALLLRQDMKDGVPSSVQAMREYYKFSNLEGDFLISIENAFLSEMFLNAREGAWSDLQIFRLLKQIKTAAPGFALIGLAFADAELEQDSQAYKNNLENMLGLLSTWFERGHEIIKPKLLMDGDAIMHYAKLPPGPIIGGLIDRLEEAQFLGFVQTIDQAKKFIDQELA